MFFFFPTFVTCIAPFAHRHFHFVSPPAVVASKAPYSGLGFMVFRAPPLQTLMLCFHTEKPLRYERPGRAAGPRTQYKSIYFWRWATHILFLRYDFMYVFWVWARRFAIGGSIKACFHILLAVYFNGFPVHSRDNSFNSVFSFTLLRFLTCHLA